MKRFSPCTLLIYHNTAKVPAHGGGSPRLQDAPKLSSHYPYYSLPQYLFCTFCHLPPYLELTCDSWKVKGL